MPKDLLQERLLESACTILDYTDSAIHVDYFYSQEMYQAYLAGVDCKQGIGKYCLNQEVFLNQIPDYHLVIVKKKNIVDKRNYKTIYSGVLTYKGRDEQGKTSKFSRTFHIRENTFGGELNLIIERGADEKRVFVDLPGIPEIQAHLAERFGDYSLEDGDLGDLCG